MWANPKPIDLHKSRVCKWHINYIVDFQLLLFIHHHHHHHHPLCVFFFRSFACSFIWKLFISNSIYWLLIQFGYVCAVKCDLNLLFDFLCRPEVALLMRFFIIVPLFLAFHLKWISLILQLYLDWRTCQRILLEHISVLARSFPLSWCSFIKSSRMCQFI